MLVNFNSFIIELNKKILIESEYLVNNKVITAYLTRYINFFNVKRSYKLCNPPYLDSILLSLQIFLIDILYLQNKALFIN